MSVKVALVAAGLFALAMTTIGPGQASAEQAASVAR